MIIPSIIAIALLLLAAILLIGVGSGGDEFNDYGKVLMQVILMSALVLAILSHH